MKSDVQQRNSVTERAIRSVLGFPVDAVLVVGYVVLVALVVRDAGVLEWIRLVSALRPALALPFVFFLPGYALLSALYPAGGEATISRDSRRWLVARGRGLDWPSRLALSFGVSLTLLPLLGLLLAVTGLGYASATVVTSLAVVIAGTTAVGAYRRLRLPRDAAYRVPYRRWGAELNEAVFGVDSRVEGALNGLLVLLVVLAVGVLAGAFAAPPSAEAFSEFYLLQQSSQGELVSSNFPREFARGESRELYVGIENHEGERTTYAVVAELQRVDTGASEPRVLEREQLDRFGVTLDAGETAHERRQVTAEMTGEDLRLVYFLYRGDAPADPSTETAYRSVYIWVDVGRTPQGGSQTRTGSR